jgi:putative ABC transport system permease protein
MAASSEVPYNGFTSNGYLPEGYKNPIMIHVVDVDDDFLKTFGLELVQGRNFSPEFATDKTAYLVNETLANTLSWDEPIGKTIMRDGKHQIIGVVKDFHFATLHDRIAPLILTHQPWLNRFENLSVKIKSATWLKPWAPSNVLATGRSVHAVRLLVLDESFGQLYQSEQRFQKIFPISRRTIFIACSAC